ncbi:MAG: alpha-mannosidase [Clostridia bacterium]|nr:alpha-mannosidase [Clostridia bacterium]
MQDIYLIGNAHLDPVWLWRWQEGAAEVLQTFRSALDRLSEYDGFVFTCSSARYYRWVKELRPDMFEEIKRRVSEGRWVIVNGWSVQPDCNMPGAEGFARQGLYSQLFYHENFGVKCTTGYNVDSFGHSHALPQMLKNSGMDCYVMMRPSPEENPDIPKGAFIWRGSDGTEILTYRIQESYTANGKKSIDAAIERAVGLAEETGTPQMLFYGVGNHGGGPTKGDIEYLQKVNEEELGGRLKFSSPDEYFLRLAEARPDLPVWNDELQHHASGCYSATSLVKQLNRKTESELVNAEKWSTVAALDQPDGALRAASGGTADFAAAWDKVCFNHFHDIMCGCSFMEAYDDVRNTYGVALDVARNRQFAAFVKIASKIDTWIDGVGDTVNADRHYDGSRDFPRPMVVFNPLSFPVRVPVRVYHPSRRVTDEKGRDVIFQNVRSSRSNDSHLDTVFIAELPALGYRTFHLYWPEEESPAAGLPAPGPVCAGMTGGDPEDGSCYIENQNIRAVFETKTGTISSFVDKNTGAEYVGSKNIAVPTVIDDHDTDTWAHGVFTFHNVKGVMGCRGMQVVETGPARAVVRAEYRFGSSFLWQDFILSDGARTLRVKCKALWNDPFTVLKMAFPLEGSDAVSTYEIQNGFIKRPCSGTEEPALTWGDLTVSGSNGRRGLAVITDSKYSYDCPGTELRLTCLRNVIFADHFSNRPDALFNFTDEGLQRFEYGVCPHSGEAETSSVPAEALIFNNRPDTIPESFHKGCEPQSKSFISVSAPNVVLQAMKLCEDGSGDVILRLYETSGRAVKTAILCDAADCGFWADFAPNEVKTFRVDADGKAAETDFLEGIC